jgi:acid phosphatase (class A)
MLSYNEHLDEKINALSSDNINVLKGKAILELETPVFGNIQPQDLHIEPPPANRDPQTIAELRYMNEYTNKPKTKEEIQFITDTDMNLIKPFLDYAWNHMMMVNKDATKALMQQSSKFERYFKHKFKRPRPQALSSLLEININTHPSKTTSTKTPAYPSGHATQTMIAALALSHEYPREQEGLIEVAMRISNARIRAGFHYPSDRDAGFEIAFQLYPHIQWDIFHRQKVQNI